MVDRRLHMVGHQDHDHVAGLGGFGGGHHLQAGGFGFGPGRAAGSVAHHHVHAGIAQVQCVRVPLASVSDDGHRAALQVVQISVFFVITFCHYRSYPHRTFSSTPASRARRHGRLQPQFLGIQRDRQRARAGHVDLAVAAHHVHEFVELLRVAGHLDGESLGGGIHHAPAEDLGLLQHRGAGFLRHADAHQHQFAHHRGRFGQVGGLQHVEQLVHLLDHLLAQGGIHVHRDGHAGELRIERARDRQTLDIVAPLAEQAGDAHQGARFIFERATKSLASCFHLASLGRHRHRLRRPQHHLVDGAACRHHGVDAFVRRHLHVQQVGSRLLDGRLERGCQLPGFSMVLPLNP